MTPAEAKAKVLEFTRRPFAAVAALEDPDGKGARLLEPGTAKELRLRWDEVAQAEERSTPMRRAPYLVLVFQDGRQVALADVGFAFAPSHPHVHRSPRRRSRRGARGRARGAQAGRPAARIGRTGTESLRI